MKLLCHFLSYLRGEPNCDRNEPKFSELQKSQQKQQQNRPLKLPQHHRKPSKDLGFFSYFLPTLIPEAFQIKTVCSKNHYQSLKKIECQ